jgi:hypothetical protein
MRGVDLVPGAYCSFGCHVQGEEGSARCFVTTTWCRQHGRRGVTIREAEKRRVRMARKKRRGWA